MWIKRRGLVVAAVILAIGLAPMLVAAAEIRWGTPPGSRVDDIVLENWEFSRFPNGVPIGMFRTVDGTASCRLERWLEETIGHWTPLVWIDERRMRRTMGNMRSIATACESHASDHGEYPHARSIDELRAFLMPTYLEAVATHDAWGRPFAFESDGLTYRIASSGSDGRWERPGLFHHPVDGFDWPTNRQLLGDLIRQWLPR